MVSSIAEPSFFVNGRSRAFWSATATIGDGTFQIKTTVFKINFTKIVDNWRFLSWAHIYSHTIIEVSPPEAFEANYLLFILIFIYYSRSRDF